jgi:hypothetical protein
MNFNNKKKTTDWIWHKDDVSMRNNQENKLNDR